MTGGLGSLRVWLTRPADRNPPWARAIREHDGRVEIEPLLTIEPNAASPALRVGLERAQTADIVIAASASAVAAARQIRPDFMPAGQLMAVGGASARALAELTGRAAVCPAQTTSEGLLAQPALVDVAGYTVAILAGEGGRSTLVDTLALRGARVDKLALYQRRPADIAPGRLAALVDWADAIIVTSAAGLRVLEAQIAQTGVAVAPTTRLVVPTDRVIQEVAGPPPGWGKALAMNDMSIDGLINTLALIRSGH